MEILHSTGIQTLENKILLMYSHKLQFSLSHHDMFIPTVTTDYAVERCEMNTQHIMLGVARRSVKGRICLVLLREAAVWLQLLL
jgi:hypothetical protein